MILTSLLSAKAAAALIGAGTLVVGGTAAAYAGVLPTPLQSVAHSVVGAPAPDRAAHPADDADDDAESPEPRESGQPSESPDPSESPEAPETPDPSTSASPHGPDATGPAAKGLCTAHSHGGLPATSTAGKALIAAAGTSSVDDYCATVLHPSAVPTSTDGAPVPTTTRPSHGKAAGTHGKAGQAHGKSGQPHGRPSTAPSPSH